MAFLAAIVITAPATAATPANRTDKKQVRTVGLSQQKQASTIRGKDAGSHASVNSQSINKSFFEIFIELLKVGTPVVTMSGIIFGIWQYRQGQNWKRMEFASSLIRRVSQEPTLSLATLFIDWKSRRILLPDSYKFLDQAQEHSSGTFFHHSYSEMSATFSSEVRETIPETDRLELKESESTVQRMVYIDSFDRLFEYFQEVDSFMAMKLIRSSDIDVLTYWAEKLLQTKHNGRYIFRWYLSYYDLWGPFTIANAGMTGNLLIFSAPIGRDMIKFHLANGKKIIIPLKLLPALKGIEPEELAKWEIIENGNKILFNSSELSIDDILRAEKGRRGFPSNPELTSPSSGQATN